MNTDSHSGAPGLLTICAVFAWVVSMTFLGAFLGATIADTRCDDEALLGGPDCYPEAGMGVGALCGGLFAVSVALALRWIARRL